MKVKALVDFGGQYAMYKGSEGELPDNVVTRCLISNGFIKEIGKAAHKEAMAKVEVQAEDPAQEPEQPEEPEVDLSKLTNPELAKMCRERGIELSGKPKKADLIAALKAQE